MRKLSYVITLSLVMTLFVAGENTFAAVTGRYIRYEAPVSLRMGVVEVEAYSEGKNILLNNKDVVFSGIQGKDGDNSRAGKELIDGKKGRAMRLQGKDGMNPFVELDLGKSYPLDKIVLEVTPGKQYQDLYWRLVTVIDENRKVVYAKQFDIRDKGYQGSELSFELIPSLNKLTGKIVPAQSEQWVPMGIFLDVKPMAAPADSQKRLAEFAKRNQPGEIEKLAKEFFTVVDINKPDLAKIKNKFAKKDYQGALDAYRDHFLKKIHGIENTWGHTIRDMAYNSQGEDLKDNIAVVFTNKGKSGGANAYKFTPGAINWSQIVDSSADKETALIITQQNANINYFQRALLSAYRDTGNKSYLDKWAEISDDWAMNFGSDADKSSDNIRDYFVKEPIQNFFWFCIELDMAMQKQVNFNKDLSSASLARLLMFAVEEYPPAYWRVCRKTVFNHTYNALVSAYDCGRILDDFYAGQRLERETRQHIERTWTYGITRDGSMQEIGDEGHMVMQLRLGKTLLSLEKNPPAWFTTDFDTRFKDGFHVTATYPIRHITPGGYDHRTGFGDSFEKMKILTEDKTDFGGSLPIPSYFDPSVTQNPEPRAIIDTVYGRGQDRSKLSKQRQTAYDFCSEYYKGPYAGTPKVISDWMPYAGLHYLRRSWEPDASFIHILCQGKESQSSNGQLWNTEFRYHDYDFPLLKVMPMTINGQQQYPDFGTQKYEPGSKTARLTEALEKPIDARWLCSPKFDFAECYYDGTYQNKRINRKTNQIEALDKAIENVRNTRQFIQIREYRIFVVRDLIEIAKSEKPYSFNVDYGLMLTEKTTKFNESQMKIDAANKKLQSKNPDTPCLTVQQFAQMPLSYKASRKDKKAPYRYRGTHQGADFAERFVSMGYKANGNNQFVTLLVPHKNISDEPVKTVTPMNIGSNTTGFKAIMADNAEVMYQSSIKAQRLNLGPVTADAEALLFIFNYNSR